MSAYPPSASPVEMTPAEQYTFVTERFYRLSVRQVPIDEAWLPEVIRLFSQLMEAVQRKYAGTVLGAGYPATPGTGSNATANDYTAAGGFRNYILATTQALADWKTFTDLNGHTAGLGFQIDKAIEALVQYHAELLQYEQH